MVNTSAAFFSTSPAAVNWLSTAFLFAFTVASPGVYWALHAHGPKLSIVIASTLVLVGNWIRYGGTRAAPPSFATVAVGQVIIGLAQPFVLAAPTSYSDLWFSPRGRVSATALASLANGLGGALGELIDPFLAVNTPDIAPMTLYVAIISSVACLPSFFIPARPPTPVAASSTHMRPPIRTQLRLIAGNVNFWLITLAFVVYVGFFNSFSSLLAQILTPYNYSQNDAGIAGAVLIVVGLVAAAITSPIVDRSKSYVLLFKTAVPVLAASYVAIYWAPGAHNDAAPFVICALIGATSFSILPVALECITEITWPVAPGLTSCLCWAISQSAGAVFIIVSEALEAGPAANPPYNMQNALIFQAVLASVVVPFVLAIGWFRPVERKRLAVDRPGAVGISAA